MSSPGGSQAQATQSGSSSSVSRNLNQSSVAMANVNVDQCRAIRQPKAYRPKIDGDFKQWVRHLEHYFTLLNIDNARKTTMLLYNLGEEASLTAFHLSLTDASNYDVAKQALMQYFSPVKTPEELRSKFHQRFQCLDESLEHYAMEQSA